MTMTHKIAISISYGPTESEFFIESTHFLSYDECELTEESARILTAQLKEFFLCIATNGTKEPVFGIYKEESSPSPNQLQ